MFMQMLKSTLDKATIAAALLSGAMLFAGAPNARASERARIIRHDDIRLNEAIVNRGFYSPRANYWRVARHEAVAPGWRDRFGCWHRY